MPLCTSTEFSARVLKEVCASSAAMIALSATDIFAKHFHCLRDFALDHPDADMIFEAID